MAITKLLILATVLVVAYIAICVSGGDPDADADADADSVYVKWAAHYPILVALAHHRDLANDVSHDTMIARYWSSAGFVLTLEFPAVYSEDGNLERPVSVKTVTDTEQAWAYLTSLHSGYFLNARPPNGYIHSSQEEPNRHTSSSCGHKCGSKVMCEPVSVTYHGSCVHILSVVFKTTTLPFGIPSFASRDMSMMVCFSGDRIISIEVRSDAYGFSGGARNKW
jgi:hypothetical protein